MDLLKAVIFAFALIHQGTLADFFNVGSICVYDQKFDSVDDDGVDTLSERSYPLLNCTTFNRTFLNEFKLNETGNLVSSVRGLFLHSQNVIPLSIADISIFPFLNTLELSNVETVIPSHLSQINQIHNVTSLSITNSKMNIFPRNLLYLFPDIVQLNLARNNLSIVEGDAFENNPKLKSLNLGHNPISKWNTSWLNGSNIERLNLRATNLDDIKIEEMFKFASSLKYLDLSDNFIIHLKGKPFRHAGNLTTLVLASNKIETINRRVFKGAFNLRFIDLTENRLQSLTDGIFDFLPSDQLTVELWENPVNCNCNLKWLQNWISKENSIGNFPEVRLKCYNPTRNHGKKFGAVSSISSSDLVCKQSDKQWHETECNKISTTAKPTKKITTSSIESTTSTKQAESTTLTTTSIPNKPKYPEGCQGYESSTVLPIKYRSLKGLSFPTMICESTNYESIPPNTPSSTLSIIMTGHNWRNLDLDKLNLPHGLKTLNLKGNHIKNLTPSVNKATFSSIESLYLESNEITSISDEFLSSFSNLQKLTLFNNQILKFEDSNFAKNQYLTRLTLGPNPMQGEFNGKCLNGLRNLIKLELRGLNIMKIPRSIKNKFTLKGIDLSDNNISIVPSDAFTNCTSLTSLTMENNKISKIETGTFRNSTILEHLDLSENFISFLSIDMFPPAPNQLSHIELWQNPIKCDCKLKPFVEWVKQLEVDNPSTEIRFQCEGPLRMQGDVSDKTTPDQYICADGDYYQQTKPIYTRQQLGVAVFITIILITIVFITLEIFRRRAKKFKGFSGSSYRFEVLTTPSKEGRSPIVTEDELANSSS